MSPGVQIATKFVWPGVAPPRARDGKFPELGGRGGGLKTKATHFCNVELYSVAFDPNLYNRQTPKQGLQHHLVGQGEDVKLSTISILMAPLPLLPDDVSWWLHVDVKEQIKYQTLLYLTELSKPGKSAANKSKFFQVTVEVSPYIQKKQFPISCFS